MIPCNYNDKECQNKRFIALFLEKLISKKVKCPFCNSKFYHFADNLPSLDIKCMNCEANFEVKSKCLSVKKLPLDLTINHGNFNEFINRINNLNLFIVIYGVNQNNETIKIREILFISSKQMNDINIEEKDGKTVISIYNRLDFVKKEMMKSPKLNREFNLWKKIDKNLVK